MTPQEFLERISNLRAQVWRGHRAPHKTIMLLMVLGRVRREREYTLHFRDMRPTFKKLLREFGPTKPSDSANRPFELLRHDGIWEVEDLEQIARYPNGHLSLNDLTERNPAAGFTREVVQLLRRHPALIEAAARELLHNQFPESYHEDILAAVGFDDGAENALLDPELPAEYGEEWHTPVDYRLSLRRVRNSLFRKYVFEEYGERCAICSYDGTMDDAPIGIEAAHIKWHAHDGPDLVRNGLALCSIHHHAVDRGGITLDENLRVRVSKRVEGETRKEYFMDFAGEPLRHRPSDPELWPSQEYLEWHRTEVFKG